MLSICFPRLVTYKAPLQLKDLFAQAKDTGLLHAERNTDYNMVVGIHTLAGDT